MYVCTLSISENSTSADAVYITSSWITTSHLNFMTFNVLGLAKIQATRMMLPRTKLFLYKSLSPGWRPESRWCLEVGSCYLPIGSMWGEISFYTAMYHGFVIQHSFLVPFAGFLTCSRICWVGWFHMDRKIPAICARPLANWISGQLDHKTLVDRRKKWEKLTHLLWWCMMYDEYLNIREITRLQGYQLQLSYFVHER